MPPAGKNAARQRVIVACKQALCYDAYESLTDHPGFRLYMVTIIEIYSVKAALMMATAHENCWKATRHG